MEKQEIKDKLKEKLKEKLKDKKIDKTKGTATGLAIALVCIILLVGGMKYIEYNKRVVEYKLGEVAFEFTGERAEYTCIQNNQIIRITQDGVTAYDIKGQEIWTDTVSLQKVVVKQKGTYFAVSNLKSRNISIFSDKGKEGEIITESNILYYSINENGDIATIEETKAGHIISAYTKDGFPIPGRRFTHIDSAGFPIAVTVSPDRSLLLASYIDIYRSSVASVIVGVYLDVDEEEAVDNIKFLVEERDNIVYELDYINDRDWIAIGENAIQYYNDQGQIIKTIDDYHLKYTPYVKSRQKSYYLPIVTSSIKGDQTNYGKQSLIILNQQGEMIMKETYDAPVTYYSADNDGIIIGQGKLFKGYTPTGKLKFTLHSTPDILQIGYMGRKPVAITRNEVILLERTEVEN
ncbi:MAG: DUF5711 family protein [Cellulosilyticaceae bacterium]